MPKAKNYIYEYYQSIKNGSILVGKWIECLYEKIINGIESKAYKFDASKANHAIDWIESHCFHTEGILAPGAFKLELWQKAMLSIMYGVLDVKTGYRQFREVVLGCWFEGHRDEFPSQRQRCLRPMWRQAL